METELGTERHCARCGASMAPLDQFCQECGAAKVDGVERTCRECAAALSPTARFCPRCGARQTGPALGAGLRGGWDHVRARAASVDWVRVGRVTAPLLALLGVGLLGYSIGRGSGSSPRTGDRVVSASRGWRSTEETPPASAPTLTATPPGASPGTGAPPKVSTLPRPSQPIALKRFRDFKVAASSYELANPPARAADGDPYTAWHAWQTERFPEGDWLTLTFPTRRWISRIGLIPGQIGPRAGVDGRVRSIIVKAAGAPPQKLVFDNRLAMQYRDLPRPVLAKTLALRFVTVQPGRRSAHIVIPEVQVWGPAAASPVARAPGG